MSDYILVTTPGGTIWVEIEETDEDVDIKLTAVQDKALRTFQEATNALKENAKFVLQTLAELGPGEVEVTFGITAGVEAGTPFFGLAKASGQASYTVKLTWKAGQAMPKQEMSK